MSLSRLFLVILAHAVVAGPAAQAAEVTSLDECLAYVESFDQAILDSGASEVESGPLEATLGKVVTHCESGAFARAGNLLDKANRQLERLVQVPPQGLTDQEFWQKADQFWGADSFRKDVQATRVKMTDDATTEMVGWRVNPDNPDGTSFDLLVVSKTDDGAIQSGHVSIPYGSGGQIGLCHLDEQYPAPEISHHAWTAEEIESHIGLPVAPYSIVIDDGMCDRIYVFWPAEANGTDDVDLVLFRN